jgi:hypothetical protein
MHAKPFGVAKLMATIFVDNVSLPFQGKQEREGYTSSRCF